MVESLNSLRQEIEQIKKRNARVEKDKAWEFKAWELNWTRRTIVAIFTYLSIGLYLDATQIPNPWFNAVVPTIGFPREMGSVPKLGSDPILRIVPRGERL